MPVTLNLRKPLINPEAALCVLLLFESAMSAFALLLLESGISSPGLRSSRSSTSEHKNTSVEASAPA